MAKNRYLPLTGGITLTTVYALMCYTVIITRLDCHFSPVDNISQLRRMTVMIIRTVLCCIVHNHKHDLDDRLPGVMLN